MVLLRFKLLCLLVLAVSCDCTSVISPARSKLDEEGTDIGNGAIHIGGSASIVVDGCTFISDDSDEADGGDDKAVAHVSDGPAKAMRNVSFSVTPGRDECANYTIIQHICFLAGQEHVEENASSFGACCQLCQSHRVSGGSQQLVLRNEGSSSFDCHAFVWRQDNQNVSETLFAVVV
jgi:hypothetical protein